MSECGFDPFSQEPHLTRDSVSANENFHFILLEMPSYVCDFVVLARPGSI